MQEIPAEIQAGISRLDKIVSGWRKKITRPINIGSATVCALGQVFGRYDTGLLRLGITNDEAVALGFQSATAARPRSEHPQNTRDGKQYTLEYGALSRLWNKALLHQKRA